MHRPQCPPQPAGHEQSGRLMKRLPQRGPSDSAPPSASRPPAPAWPHLLQPLRLDLSKALAGGHKRVQRQLALQGGGGGTKVQLLSALQGSLHSAVHPLVWLGKQATHPDPPACLQPADIPTCRWSYACTTGASCCSAYCGSHPNLAAQNWRSSSTSGRPKVNLRWAVRRGKAGGSETNRAHATQPAL